MILVKRYALNKDCNLEEFLKVKQMAMESLFSALAEHEIEMDRPYSLVFKDDSYRTFDTFLAKEFPEEFPNVEQRKMSVNFEPIPQRRAYYLPPEKEYLKPEKSFFQKLKNCWAYLRDETGGKLIIEEEK